MTKLRLKFGTRFSLHRNQTTFSMLRHVDSKYLRHNSFMLFEKLNVMFKASLPLALAYHIL
jgi:hypothetical protein